MSRFYHRVADGWLLSYSYLESRRSAVGGRLLHDAIDPLTDSLLSHLSYEERELLPAITRYGLASGQI